jgi:Putative  PD-(D/E)XK family member, (DUF4420)
VSNIIDIKSIFNQVRIEALSIYSLEKKEGNLEKKISVNNAFSIYVSIEVPSELIKISFLVDKKNFDIVQPLSFDGFKVGYRANQNSQSGLFLDVALEHQKFSSIFAVLCNDLINTVSQVFDERELLKRISTRLDYWREFLKNSRKDLLSKEEVVGLMGELVVLKSMLSCKPDTNVFKIWNGPKRATHDFTNEAFSIEVKTSIKQGGSVKISSEYQLDKKTPNEELCLCYVELTEVSAASSSINLTSLVDSIYNILPNGHRESFGGMMELVGFKEQDREYYQQFNFILNEIVLYEVRDDFPRLLSKDLDPSIRNVSYELKLNGLDSYRVDYESFVLRYMGASK